MVRGVVRWSSCRSIILSQEGVAFIEYKEFENNEKAICTLQLSLGHSQLVQDGSFQQEEEASSPGWELQHRAMGRGRSPPNDQQDSLRASAKPHASPATSEGSAPLPANATAVTGEQAASRSRQLGAPEGGATYGLSPRFSQVGRSIPQPMDQSTGACLATCPGL
jgi:hypothetical protein